MLLSAAEPLLISSQVSIMEVISKSKALFLKCLFIFVLLETEPYVCWASSLPLRHSLTYKVLLISR